jgi:hypothetical protein
MAQYEWKELHLPKEFSENGEVYFKFSSIPGMLISVQQGSPLAGIKMLLIVNTNFDEMEKFYTCLTGKLPLPFDNIKEGFRYRKYSLSRKLELQLVLHPKLKSHQVQNVNLCFAIDDKSMSGIPGDRCNIGEKHWQVMDPDGNSVILYSLLRE